jgi:hypothetical protein
MKYLALIVLAWAAAPMAHAQPESAYYGLSLGDFDYDEGEGGVVDNVSSWRVMVGYQFLEHLAVEGGYGETGTIRGRGTAFSFTGPVPIDISLEFKILTIRLLGVLPFDNGVKLLGGLGYADMKQKFSLVNANNPADGASGSIDGNEPAYYLGAQYDWDRVAVRLAYEKYDFSGGTDVNETSVTFFYKL